MSKQKDGNFFKKHKILTGVLVLIVIIIAASAASGGDKTNTGSNGNETKTDDKKATTAKVGEAARDGKFEFIVKSVKCGKASVGSEFLTETAQGQYCLLSVSVKNIGDEAQSLISDNLYLFNAEGQKYSADSAATFAATPNGSSWYDDINPGNSVSGSIVFDVPKGQTPTSAELHDSAFSSGVKVNL